MKPTSDQTRQCLQVLRNTGTQDVDRLLAAILHWESIRPKDPQELPEWIPVGEFMPNESQTGSNDGFLIYLMENGETRCEPIHVDFADYSITHFLPCATLAALPKRQPTPKPTAEDVERMEFEAWAESQGYHLERTDDGYTTPRSDNGWKAWKAARASKGGAA